MTNVLRRSERANSVKSSSRGRAFYLEVLLLLAGFALVSVVIFQLFGTAYQLSNGATATEHAVTSARSIAELYTASDDDAAFAESLAAAEGVAGVSIIDSDISYRDAQGCTVFIALDRDPAGVGWMRRAHIMIDNDDATDPEPLYTLDATVYESGTGVTS